MNFIPALLRLLLFLTAPPSASPPASPRPGSCRQVPAGQTDRRREGGSSGSGVRAPAARFELRQRYQGTASRRQPRARPAAPAPAAAPGRAPEGRPGRDYGGRLAAPSHGHGGPRPGKPFWNRKKIIIKKKIMRKPQLNHQQYFAVSDFM